MKKNLLLLIFAVMTFCGAKAQIMWDAEHLAQVRSELKDNNFYSLVFEHLKADADAMLNAQPLSVMMKEKTPASGDKHDYMSMARYFWPDPNKEGGLSYINRDGVTNPEINKYDRNPLGVTAERITTLSLVWYLSGEDAYARKAVELIRVWFLNKDTKMNPNLEYAQMVPGHNGGKGRCYGVLDTYSFVEMVNGVKLLEQSKAFPKQEQKQLREWFKKLTHWMLTSQQGIEEGNGQNNHSIAYDAQVMAFAKFAADTKTVNKVASEFATKRIYKQIGRWDDAVRALCKDLYRTAAYIDNTRPDFINIHKTYKNLDIDGRLAMVGSYDWCSGFFPGSLWMIYDYTRDDYWRKEAISFTWPIEDAKWHKGSHDLGFQTLHVTLRRLP